MKSIKHKVGATFELQGRYMRAGAFIDLVAEQISIRSQVRDSSGTLVAELEVAIKDQAITPGGYRLRCGDTSSWPASALVCDIRYVDQSGTLDYTETLLLKMGGRVTI